MAVLPTCKEIHRLASEKFDRELSLHERWRLRLHLFSCIACRNFDVQLQLIRRAMHHMAHADEPAADAATRELR